MKRGRKRKSEPGFRPVANPEMAQAFRELRRSNATVPKPAKTARKARSRSGAKHAAIMQAW